MKLTVEEQAVCDGYDFESGIKFELPNPGEFIR